MAEGGGQGDLEYWLEGPPRRGPLPQKTLHWEVRGRTPGIWQTQEWLLRDRRKRAFCPWPKRWLTKDRLSEKKAGGWWEFLSQGCESDLVKTSKPFNGTNSSWTLGDSQEKETTTS